MMKKYNAYCVDNGKIRWTGVVQLGETETETIRNGPSLGFGFHSITPENAEALAPANTIMSVLFLVGLQSGSIYAIDIVNPI